MKIALWIYVRKYIERIAILPVYTKCYHISFRKRIKGGPIAALKMSLNGSNFTLSSLPHCNPVYIGPTQLGSAA